MKIMTINEAIASGYKYFFQNDSFYELKKDTDIKTLSERHLCYLAEKEPKPFQLDDNIIEELISDYLDAQDVVYDEDGVMNSYLSGCDFTEITKTVNDAIGKVTFYHATEIILKP